METHLEFLAYVKVFEKLRDKLFEKLQSKIFPIIKKYNRNLLWKQNKRKDKQSIIKRTCTQSTSQIWLAFITHPIQHLHEWNNSKLEPDLHKRHYFINQYKKTLHFAEDKVTIANKKDILQTGVFLLQNKANNFGVENHKKNLRWWHFKDNTQ